MGDKWKLLKELFDGDIKKAEKKAEFKHSVFCYVW